ncbi:hypothetical protein MRB53_041169 [Persea americana]|nr:hypothetical protein MRB53_041169 [Persea americana]
MGRSLFASSASTSAAAKLEAHTTTPSRPSPTREFSNESSFSVNMPGALHSEATLAKSPSRPLSIMSFGSTRKARKSGEAERKKDEESRAQQKAASDLDKAREMERAKVAAEQAHARELKEREAEQKAVDMKTKAESSKSALPLVGKLKSVSRPVKPVKEAAKEKPAPINVKVTSQLQHREEPPARAPSIPNSRVRALEAAQRKKDLEDKAKQKKAEQKKELERKRLAKQEEEERKAEQERRAEEQRRAHEAKIAAQRQAEKQAAEAKRREEVKLEQQRREHQQRLEAKRQQEEKAKADELAEIIARERAQQQAQSRTDLTGTIRSLAQKTFGDSSRPPIQMNPAKPPKRNLQDADDQRAAQQSYQQDGAKRRKTDELEENGHRASVMAPPKRPSTIRKVSILKRQLSDELTYLQETMTRFPHGYSQAAPSHPPTSIFKSAVTNQYQPNQKSAAHPSQLVQMSNARIAFADQPQVAVPSGHPESSKHKTPVRPAPVSAKSVAKSSPMYPNGDNITLPEIATDSEEEPESDDEDNGFRAPSWVASPALRELIARQQLVDPETVFGPIGELKMEEVFKGAKGDRLKKFRDRGSSAAWVQNGDAVTSAEKQRDMEMRETIARQGHWSYQPGM